MQRIFLTTVLLAIGASIGCTCSEPAHPFADDRDELNALIVQSYFKEAAANAVLAEHTLYAHHFCPNSSALTELGQQHVEILSAHYAAQPGALNVRRGDTSEELYDARIQTVRDAMADAGVEVDGLEIGDGPVGGRGISSEQALLNYARSRRVKSYDTVEDTPDLQLIDVE